jgi:uncharacterized protein
MACVAKSQTASATPCHKAGEFTSVLSRDDKPRLNKGNSGLIGSVWHFEIYAEEPSALAEFYRQLFGWRIELAPGTKYWRIETGAMLARDFSGAISYRPIASSRAWVNYVHVASLDDLLAHAERLAAVVLRPKTAVPKTGWYAVLADPEGNIFGVYQSASAVHAPQGPE